MVTPLSPLRGEGVAWAGFTCALARKATARLIATLRLNKWAGKIVPQPAAPGMSVLLVSMQE